MSELISGEDAIIAVFRGEQDVQYRNGGESWFDIGFDHDLDIRDFQSEYFEFRRKPKTISVTLELPESFQPRFGEKYWFIAPANAWGHDYATYDDDSYDQKYTQFGAYRTEEDVIMACNAFRQLKAK